MDNWEHWDDYEKACLPNEQQLKVLEERKLVEESDNALTKHLFEDDLAYEEVNKYKQTPSLSSTEKKAPEKKLVSKKQANEQKQKQLSNLIKGQKAKKERERELFGEAAENEYAEYEDRFYY
jgi:hypothetical protein